MSKDKEFYRDARSAICHFYFIIIYYIFLYHKRKHLFPFGNLLGNSLPNGNFLFPFGNILLYSLVENLTYNRLEK